MAVTTCTKLKDCEFTIALSGFRRNVRDLCGEKVSRIDKQTEEEGAGGGNRGSGSASIRLRTEGPFVRIDSKVTMRIHFANDGTRGIPYVAEGRIAAPGFNVLRILRHGAVIIARSNPVPSREDSGKSGRKRNTPIPAGRNEIECN